MKVICVNNGPLKNPSGQIQSSPELAEGIEYNASQCYTYNHCYDIEGHLFDPVDGNRCSYQKCRFIPLSSIDETEMIRNYKTEVV